MSVNGPTWEEYREVLQKGGKLVFVINTSDIEYGGAFENIDSIKSNLYTGFDLPPSPLDAKMIAQIIVYGDTWGRVIANVYGCRGKITYKKTGDNQYEAVCDIPVPSVVRLS